MNHRLEYVFNLFENILPRKYASKEIRKTQVQLAVTAADVFSPFSKYKTLVAHAPVGTGKTFAALVPAIYDSAGFKSRVIYSTSSLNLQAQLKNEELKYLYELKEIEQFIVAKGVSNYFCLRNVHSTELPLGVQKDLIKYGHESSEGDRVEFEKNFYPLIDEIWDKIKLETQSQCYTCDFRNTCPTYTHRRKFNDPNINVVVTNHNQLIQSVINKQKGDSPILNYNVNPGTVIIDEAHDFEDAVLNQLSENLRLSDLRYSINTLNPKTRDFGQTSLDVINHYIKELRQKLDTVRGRHPIGQSCAEALKRIHKLVHEEISERDSRKLAINSPRTHRERESKLENIAELIGKIVNQKDYTSWLTFEDRETVYITIISNQFRRIVRGIIRDLNINNKLLFMSGTLAVNESFSSMYYSWGGAPEGSQELILDTVFDYKKQALVYVPLGLPVPISTTSEAFSSYTETLSKEIIDLIKITGGRTLILCTSHKQMDLLSELLILTVESLGITFLKQGQKSIELLSEDFKKDESSVLIGTGSFFAGLSVPGKSLISVILCKLPFPAADPFIDLISEGLTQSEKLDYVTVPRMLIRLLQAGGRLIRTIEDFGCFTILDPRVYDGGKEYSEKIQLELAKAGYVQTRDREVVATFINERLSNPGDAQYPEYHRDLIDIPDSLTKQDKPRDMFKRTASSSLKDFEKTITPNQENYYKKIRASAKRLQIIKKSIREPYQLFKDLVELNDTKNLGFNIIEDFPYVTEMQKDGFVRRIKQEQATSSSPVKTVTWTPEQLEAYFKSHSPV